MDRPDVLQDAVDGAVRRMLDRLPALLVDLPDADDDAVFVLRHVDIELQVDASWDSETIAARWVGATRAVLAAAMTTPDDGTSVRRFSGAAEHLAGFLVELATGYRSEPWVYAPFDGLRHLPVGSAIRTALLDRPEVGRAALAMLSKRERARVIGAMSDAEARRVLDGFAGDGIGDPSSRIPAVISAWTDEAPDLAIPDARAALSLYVAAADADPDGVGRACGRPSWPR